VTVITDDNGLASVRFTLGNRSGQGNHRVMATAAGFVGMVEFCATATTKPATILTALDMGSKQSGIVGQELPQPVVALVTDDGGNPVPGVNVTFTVAQGGGNFDGGPSAIRTTDVNGQVAAKLTLGPDEGLYNNVVTATFDGYTGTTPTFLGSGLIPGPPAETSVSGIAVDNQDNPLEGVTLHIDGTNLSAVTDAQGQFHIVGVPVGHIRRCMPIQ